MSDSLGIKSRITGGVTPVIHVDNSARSLRFYQQLGFEVVQSLEADRHSAWTLLRNGEAELMIATATEPVEVTAQGVFLYLYSSDIVGLYDELKALGLAPGEMHNPPYMPAGEFRLADPDGYVLLFGQLSG
jgi:catechol 2,3-dioxygenase-like lactoylglutathione lyase family enzyme